MVFLVVDLIQPEFALLLICATGYSEKRNRLLCSSVHTPKQTECCLPWDVFRTPMAFSSSFLKHAGCWMRGLHQIQQIPLLQEETDRLTHPCGEADPLSNRIQLCCCIPLFVQIYTGTNLSFISKC